MASSGKCLGKGSSPPGPVPNGRIRLYSMRFCPFAQRSRLVLHAKGIKHDTINIDLKDKPDWFLKKNPLGAVPVLETPGGQVIYESSIICEYLDEVYPEKKLVPVDPFEKAQQKMLLEHFSKVYPEKKLVPVDPFEKAQQKMLLEHFSKISPYFYRIPMMKTKGEDTANLEEELKEKLLKLNETLAGKKTKFFGGDSITMIDYMIWPWFERIESLSLKHCVDGAPDLKAWTERMLQDSSVKALMFDTETLKGYYNTYLEGKPDYDYGL